MRAVFLLAVVCVLHAAGAEQCPNHCSGRGECDSSTAACTCYQGYTGADCSLRTSTRHSVLVVFFFIFVWECARARVWLCVTSHVVAGRANRSVPVRRGLV